MGKQVLNEMGVGAGCDPALDTRYGDCYAAANKDRDEIHR